MAKVRLCKRCGGPIEANHSEAKYCDACRATIHMENWDTLREKRRQTAIENLKKAQAAKAEQNKRKYKGPTLKELNDCAQAHGMIYGQYGSVII